MGGSVTEEHLTTIYHKRPRIAQQFATLAIRQAEFITGAVSQQLV